MDMDTERILFAHCHGGGKGWIVNSNRRRKTSEVFGCLGSESLRLGYINTSINSRLWDLSVSSWNCDVLTRRSYSIRR